MSCSAFAKRSFAEKVTPKRRHAGRGFLMNAWDAIKRALQGRPDTGPPGLAVKALSSLVA
jgi:hypothetical protein